MISPRPANRMLVPRLFLMVVWLLAGVAAGIGGYCYKSDEPIIAWMFAACLVFTGMLIPMLGKRDAWGVRVRRTIPRNRLLRWLAFLVYTGSAGGLLWCSLMIGATLLATQVYLGSVTHRSVLRMPYNSWAGPPFVVYGYVLCYCLTTVSLRPTLLKKLPTSLLPHVAAIFGLLMTVTPYLIAFFIGVQWRDIPPWYLFGGPLILGADSWMAGYLAPPIVLAWSIVCLTAILPWLNGQWVRFVPYPEDSPRSRACCSDGPK